MRKLALIGSAVLIAVATGVVAFELLARLIFGPPVVHMLTAETHDIQTDFDVTYGLKADRTRWTCPAPATPDRRLAVIGDSFAFGQGVPDSEDFVARLSCQMRGAEVVNFGVSGQDFLYYEIALRSLISADVDDIILLIYENDLPQADAESFSWRVKRALYRSSHVLVMLRKAKQQLGQKVHRTDVDSYKIEARLNNPKTVITSNPAFFSDLTEPSRYRLELFDRAFLRFMETSRRVAPKARVFVAFAPEASTVSKQHRSFYRSLGDVPLPTFGEPSALNRRTQALCSRVPGCSFIDLFPTLMQKGDSYYFPHDFHWNAEGHRAVAGVVLAALTEARRRSGPQFQ